MRPVRFSVLLAWLLILAACAPGDGEKAATLSPATTAPLAANGSALPGPTTAPTVESATALAPEATALQPEAPSADATAEGEGTATMPAAEEAVSSGRSEDGAYFLGQEDAPLTIVDYSDFL